MKEVLNNKMIMAKKRIMAKIKKEIQKRNQNTLQICRKVRNIIRNFNNNKNGWNVKSVKHFQPKVTKTLFSSYNAQVKNSLNL